MTGGPIRVVELRGKPFERGAAHDRELAELIARYWEELVREVTVTRTRP